MILANSSAAKVGTTIVKAIVSSTATARQFMCYDTLTISTAISGTVGVEKNGNGNLTLSGANTYTGLTKIKAGKIITSKTNGSITATAEFGVNAMVEPIIESLNVSFAGGTPLNGATFKFFEGSTAQTFASVVAITNSPTLRGTFNNTNSTLTLNTVTATAVTNMSNVQLFYPLPEIPDQWTVAQTNPTNVKSVVVGDGVTIIGFESFKNCTNLTSVTIPYSVLNIKYDAFFNCASLQSIVIGDGVDTIGNQAFANCVLLTGVTIPYGVINLGVGVFNGCTALISILCAANSTYFSSEGGVLFNKTVTKLIQYPVGKSSSVYTNMPTTVSEIGAQSCAGSSNLTTVTIPTSVTNIGAGAFGDCISLTSAPIPASVTTIGDGIFKQCDSLLSIVVAASNLNFTTGIIGSGSSDVGVLFNTNKTKLVMFPTGRGGNYIVPSSVTVIQSQAFEGASKLQVITINNNTISIIDNATFQGCDKLVSFIVPAGVSSIGNNAFRGCNKLASVTLPTTGLQTINVQAFYACPDLTSITIPSTVTTIGASAFQKCAKLITINCNVSRDIMVAASNALVETATVGPIFTPTINVRANDGSWTAGLYSIAGRTVNVAKNLPD